MLTRQRQQLILQRLHSEGQILAGPLSAELGVSEDTIRRDLRELARTGKLLRVHGGALPVSPALGDLSVRAGLATDEKQRLAQAAAAMIEPGQVVFFDGGTSTLALAQALPAALRATVVTHSPVIAAALIPHPAVEVLVLGGKLFKHSGVTMSAATVDAIRAIRADTYFMGVTGVHAVQGLSTGDGEEAHIKHAMLECAADTVLMATADKIGRASPYIIAPASVLSCLITSSGASAVTLTGLRGAGVRVLEV